MAIRTIRRVRPRESSIECLNPTRKSFARAVGTAHVGSNSPGERSEFGSIRMGEHDAGLRFARHHLSMPERVGRSGALARHHPDGGTMRDVRSTGFVGPWWQPRDADPERHGSRGNRSIHAGEPEAQRILLASLPKCAPRRRDCSVWMKARFWMARPSWRPWRQPTREENRPLVLVGPDDRGRESNRTGRRVGRPARPVMTDGGKTPLPRVPSTGRKRVGRSRLRRPFANQGRTNDGPRWIDGRGKVRVSSTRAKIRKRKFSDSDSNGWRPMGREAIRSMSVFRCWCSLPIVRSTRSRRTSSARRAIAVSQHRISVSGSRHEPRWVRWNLARMSSTPDAVDDEGRRAGGPAEHPGATSSTGHVPDVRRSFAHRSGDPHSSPLMKYGDALWASVRRTVGGRELPHGRPSANRGRPEGSPR